MSKSKIPTEWPLSSNPRYKRQNMDSAMRGRIERGFVELITNSDDSYRNLEECNKHVSGKIRIEIERRKKGQHSIVIVRDRAAGMSREELYYKLGELGKRTSGFERGEARRGLHGRGSRDVAAFGTVHFESIKNGLYNHLIIPASLKCKFTDSRPKKASEEIRKKLGILKGNGTVVTIDVDSRFSIPQHETLLKDFSRFYSLRDIFSNKAREVTVVDLNKNRTDPLIYRFPEGEVVINDRFSILDYPNQTFHLTIRRHASPFDREMLPCREGILVKSKAAIHDCTYFGLDSEIYAWRFSGELICEYIDKLIREYDDREETNPDKPNHPKDNPIRLLHPFRDRLIQEHPFVQSLYAKCKKILQPLIDELKASEETKKSDVTDENLDRKLNGLSKELSKIFEKKLNELDEEFPTEDIDEAKIRKLGIGLHIIPPNEQPIIINQPKTFSIVVKHYETLDNSLPVEIISSNPHNVKVRKSPKFLKYFMENKEIGKTTFTIEGNKIGAEAFLEVRYDGYDSSIRVKVIEPPPPPNLPYGFYFEKPKYHLTINKIKNLTLWLKTSNRVANQYIANIASDNPEIFIKGGGRCILRERNISGVFSGNIKVIGHQSKTKGKITALIKGFKPAETQVFVEDIEPRSGMNLKIKIVEDYFGAVRYKWDIKNSIHLLSIGAKHPSIRKYLGEPKEGKYPGIDSPSYHTILAEVISEAATFFHLEKIFKKHQGKLDFTETEFYFHKEFSEFLKTAHNSLVSNVNGQ